MNKEHTITTYSTSQMAKIVGLHPNTVRLYEEWGFIQKPERKKNGYRVCNNRKEPYKKVWQLCCSGQS